MTDEIDWHDLSEKDLPLLVKAFQEAARTEGGGRAVGVITEDRMRVVLGDMLDQRLAPIYAKIGKFLEDAQIERRIEEKFERVGLRVDDDHYEQTAEAVRWWMRSHKMGSKVAGGIALSIITAVVYGLLKMVGVQLPSPGAN